MSDPHPLSMKGTRREKAYLGGQASHAATKRLREMFAEEYAELLAEEREARGLPAVRKRDALQALRDRVRELEEVIAELGGEA